MSDPTSILAWLSIKASTFFAAFVGNLVGLNLLPPMPYLAKIVTIVSGVAVSHYAVDIILWMYPHVQEVDGAIAFFIGIFGMLIVKSIMDILPATVRRLMGRIK